MSLIPQILPFKTLCVTGYITISENKYKVNNEHGGKRDLTIVEYLLCVKILNGKNRWYHSFSTDEEIKAQNNFPKVF